MTTSQDSRDLADDLQRLCCTFFRDWDIFQRMGDFVTPSLCKTDFRVANPSGLLKPNNNVFIVDNSVWYIAQQILPPF